MAQQRNNPYPGYNFLVDLGIGDSDSVQAGFSEVELPDINIDIIEYRNGNDKLSTPRKLPGLAHYGNLVLHRGVLGALDLYQWIRQTADGDPNAYRTVRVSLLNEDRSASVLVWIFQNAFPVQYKFSSLAAQASQVLVETLELAVGDMRVE